MTRRTFGFVISLFLLAAAPWLHGQTQLIVNGGFENGPDNPNPWVLEDSIVSTPSDATYARSGTYFLWLGGLAPWFDDAYQFVTLPTGLSSATLSFYYNVNTFEGTTTAKDFFSASIRNTSGSTLATITNLSNVNADFGVGSAFYHQQTFNLLPYAGQTVAIYFESQNDNSAETSFFIDDVSVAVTFASGPADLTPQNVSVSPTTALAGGTVTVNYTVANAGGVAAPASHTKVVIKDPANNVFTQQIFPTAAVGIGGTTNESHTMGLVGAIAGSTTST